MKKVWIIIGAVLLALAIAGASFWGGMRYASAQAAQTAQQFFQGGFGDRAGQFPGGQFSPGEQLPEAMRTRQAGRGTVPQVGEGIVGTIQAIEGTVVVLNTSDGAVRIETTGTTLIQKTMNVGVDDLEVDEQVMVLGRQNDDGTITARSIQPLRMGQAGQPAAGE